jgi:GcrA cell cycle regulator
VNWTPERIEQLTALAARGLTASQIATEIGGITRMSVLGKLNRMGIALSRHAEYIGSPWDKGRSGLLEKLYIGACTIEQMAEQLQTTVGAVRGRLGRLRKKDAVKPRKRTVGFAGHQARKASARVIRMSDASPIMVPFMELGPGQCRYIPGDVIAAETIYCGAPVEDGQSYCSPHCRTCFAVRNVG